MNRLKDSPLAARLQQTLSAWSTEGRPWMGYLLLGAILLVLLAVLCLVAAGLLILSAVAGRGEADFSGGIPLAILWLCAVFSAIGVGMFYFWWQFCRGGGPRRVHGDLEAAQGGDAAAAHRLGGQHYRHRDSGSARAWLLRAAQGGVAEAMVDLAEDLREGRGGPRDLASAQAWLQRAAEAGEPRAQALLADVESRLVDRHSELEAKAEDLA